MIHYWDASAGMVSTWYYDSTCLGKAAATDVFEKFNSTVKNVDEIKFLQVVSDDPNVNKLSRLIIDESPGRRADYKKIATAVESDYAL